MNVSHGFGGAEDEETAISHSIFEAIEHYCILHEREDLFIRGTYNELKPKAVDPLRFAPFSPKQLLMNRFEGFVFDHDTPFNWLKGYSLTSQKEVLIPASVAYANYSSKEHSEPMIRRPISTGAACGPNTNFAISRGLCEIIERDGYMISFLPEMPKKLIVIDKTTDKEICTLISKFKRYGLEIFFIDTTLDNPVFSVVCLLVDKTGCGPAVCAGLGGSLDPREAIRTSAIEAIRRYVSNLSAFFQPKPGRLPRKYSFDWFLRKRLQLWSSPHMIGRVRKLVKNAKKVKLVRSRKFKDEQEKVDYLVQKMNKLGCEVFYIDMTIPEVEKFGLRVIKVLCPEMVPLWHDETLPYLGAKRLSTVPKKYGIRVDLELSEEELMNIHPF